MSDTDISELVGSTRMKVSRSFYMTPGLYELLSAIAFLERKKNTAIIQEALLMYFMGLAQEKREAVLELRRTRAEG